MSVTKRYKAVQALRRALAKFPNHRVGQLIDNAMWSEAKDDRPGLFYIGDDELAKVLDAYVKAASK